MTELDVGGERRGASRAPSLDDRLLDVVANEVGRPLDHYTRTLLCEVRSAVRDVDAVEVRRDSDTEVVVLSGDLTLVRPSTLARFEEISVGDDTISVRLS